LASLWQSGAQERADPWQASVAPTSVRGRVEAFAVTESLVGAGIAPSIHLGRGIIITEASMTTRRWIVSMPLLGSGVGKKAAKKLIPGKLARSVERDREGSGAVL
jgi:hypothetical protein